MAGPAPEALTDIPPAARDAVSALTAAPGEPVKILVSGGSAPARVPSSRWCGRRYGPQTLPVIDQGSPCGRRSGRRDRDRRRASARRRGTRPTRRAGVRSGIDDRRRGRTAHPTDGVAGAYHRAGARESGDIARLADPCRDRRGGRFGDRSSAASGSRSGPDGLDRRPAVLIASRDGRVAVSPNGEPAANAIVQAAKYALIERLRRVEEPVLDTLLVSSLSPELGPDDVAAALRLDADERNGWSTAPAPAGSSSPRTARRSCGRSILASLRSSALQGITTSRSPYSLPDRIDDAVVGSRAEDGRSRPARRSARKRAGRPRYLRTETNRPRPQGFTVPQPKRERPQSAPDLPTRWR